VAEVSIAEGVRYAPAHGVSLHEAFRVWLRVACLSFGGPAGQIAVMHRILVEEKRWVSEQRFLHALNYCMLLPGPEAQQLATYIGWLMHRTLGGIIAGGLFVVPGIIAIMALSYVYAGWGNVPVIVALFFGLKAAVLAIVLEAGFRIGRRALKNRVMIGLAALAFIGIFFFNVPFPIIVFGAACSALPLFKPATGMARAAQAGRLSSTPCSARRYQNTPVPPSRARWAFRLFGSHSGSFRSPRCSSHSAAPTSSARSRCSSARWRL
jgi:chromate transport protein ChrA